MILGPAAGAQRVVIGLVVSDEGVLAEFALEFADLAAVLHGEGEPAGVLARVIDLAVKHVPGCSSASISELTEQGNFKTVVASDSVAASADEQQRELEVGPSVQAAESNTSFLIADVGSETRWPRYVAALAAFTPVRSVLVCRLVAERASLNLYAETAEAFDPAAVTTAAVFAAHVSTTLALAESESHAANLNVALDSSRRIGAAIGILMALHKVTDEEAFQLLRAASQHLHRKLRDVAEEVVETGVLPELPDTRPDR